jgi:hypothetical protein
LITTFSGFIKAREKDEREGERTGRKLRGGTEGEKNTGNKNTTEELTKKRPGTEEDFEHRRRTEGGRTGRKLRGRTGGN